MLVNAVFNRKVALKRKKNQNDWVYEVFEWNAPSFWIVWLIHPRYAFSRHIIKTTFYVNNPLWITFGTPRLTPEFFDRLQDTKSFDGWSLKKSILNTLLQAVKAIAGGITTLKGQLIKGSGYLVSGGGKVSQPWN